MYRYPEHLLKKLKELKELIDTLILDAGHGGYDAGASGHGFKEKDLALKFVKDLKKEIERLTDQLKVVLTREKDEFISLGMRAKIANKYNSKTTLFVSKHLNSASVNTAKGTETFHYPTSSKGKSLASAIQNAIVKNNLTRANRGIKARTFSVLKGTNMPSCLLESCFINNKEDLDFFLNNYDKFVEIIAVAILEHIGMVKVSDEKPVAKPQAPVKETVTIVENKMNMILIAEHVAMEGFIKNGTSYINVNDSFLSIREILEKLSLKVGWDDELKIITADTSGEFVKEEGLTDILLLGNKINVKTHMHNDKHCMKIDNAYIPIRDIFESLGFVVKWNDVDKMIWIDK